MSLTFHANGLITGSKITMPEGSGCKGAVIQRVKVERGGNTGTADISRNSDGGWDDVNTISFTPFYSNSIINMHMNYSVGSQNNVKFYFRYAYDNGNGSDVEIERTGRHHNVDYADAHPGRFDWNHQYVQGNTSTYTYKLQGNKESGGSSNVIWYHTYGNATTSIFEITEIKQ